MSRSKDTDSVAENFKKLYGQLPSEINIQCPSSDAETINTKAPITNKVLSKNNSKEPSDLESFLQQHLPRSDHKEIGDELRKTYPLYKQKGGKIKKPQPKRKGKYLTSHERRQLGLNRLPKSGGLKVSICYTNICCASGGIWDPSQIYSLTYSNQYCFLHLVLRLC